MKPHLVWYVFGVLCLQSLMSPTLSVAENGHMFFKRGVGAYTYCFP